MPKCFSFLCQCNSPSVSYSCVFVHCRPCVVQIPIAFLNEQLDIPIERQSVMYMLKYQTPYSSSDSLIGTYIMLCLHKSVLSSTTRYRSYEPSVYSKTLSVRDVCTPCKLKLHTKYVML